MLILYSCVSICAKPFTHLDDLVFVSPILLMCILIGIVQIIFLRYRVVEFSCLILVPVFVTKFNYTVEDYLLQIILFNFLLSRLLSLEFHNTILLCVLNLSQSILSAGIEKAFDPAWSHGVGFYYVCNLKWLLSASFAFLGKYNMLSVLLNYSAIAFELFFIITIFLRPLRRIGAIALVLFFVILTVVLRVDFIGPFGLIISTAYLACIGRINNLRIKEMFTSKTKYVFLVYITLIAICTANQLSSILINKYPRVQDLYLQRGDTVDNAVMLTRIVSNTESSLYAYSYMFAFNMLKITNNIVMDIYSTTRYLCVFKEYHLFDINHCFPLFTYEIHVISPLERYHFPVFTETQSGDTLTAHPLVPRAYQTKMYLFTRVANAHCVNDTDRQFINQIIDHVEDVSGLTDIYRTQVFIRPIVYGNPFKDDNMGHNPDRILLISRDVNSQLSVHRSTFSFEPLFVTKDLSIVHSAREND